MPSTRRLSRGSISPSYFASKYDVNVYDRFRDQIASLETAGYLASKTDDLLAITRNALLRVDVLLPQFFLPQHTGIRYT